MENLVFDNLLIFDEIDKVAKRISFSTGKNLLTNQFNSHGKSIIMKSLYHTMGANATFDEKFVYRQKTFILTYSCNNINYKICRKNNDYILFKNNKLCLIVPNKKISKLSEFYKSEFGFFVYLRNRKEELEIAPPAYSFSPYYLDQDNSWKQYTEPFSNDQQYEKLSRKELNYYHLSVYDEVYRIAKFNSVDITKKISEANKTIKHFDTILSELKGNLDIEDISLNEVEMESLVRNIKLSINEELEVNDKMKKELYAIENAIITLKMQMKNAKNTIKKFDKENIKLEEHVIICPNCNTKIDSYEMEKLRNQYNMEFLKNSISQWELELDDKQNNVEQLRGKIVKSDKLLDTKYARIAKENELFTKFINRQACSNLIEKHIKDINDVQQKLQKYCDDEKNNKLIIARYDEKKRTANRLFREFYLDNLFKLGITSIEMKNIKAFEKVKLSGSQYVRSTLAYYLAFLDSKKVLDANMFNFPLVIDSPREGEQDEHSSQDIIKNIFKRIKSSQVIVATIEGEKYIEEIDEDINVIKLVNDKYKLLESEVFEDSIDEIYEIIGLFNNLNS